MPLPLHQGLNPTDPRPIKRKNVKVLSAGLTESVQGFPPLPSISGELKALHSLYGANMLLNQNFINSKLERELREIPFTIMHIASHAQFEGDVKKTFLLTFNNRLTVDQLEQYVGLFKFRKIPWNY